MIYADYNGSAPVSREVKEYLTNRLENDGPYANPNAIHFLGSKCLMAMEKARKVCAKSLGAQSHQIIFNSGASEGISSVFFSLLDRCGPPEKDIIVISGIEHSAALNAALFYESRGYRIKYIETKSNGEIDIVDLEKILEQNKNKVAMVCAMAANNETGVIQPYKKISEISKLHQVPYFCDSTQIVGKAKFSFEESGADYAVMSGHKVGALTGTGILLAKDPTSLKPFIFGGGQENNLRGGTQNYIGNECLAVALTAFEENLPNIKKLAEKRIEFEAKIKESFPKVVIIGEDAERLATTSYISYPGIHGQAVQIELESQDIFVTTSSACSDNEPSTSKVLKSMGIPDDIGRGVVRISIGLSSPHEYYDKIYDALKQAYEKVIKIKSY